MAVMEIGDAVEIRNTEGAAIFEGRYAGPNRVDTSEGRVYVDEKNIFSVT